MAKWSDLVDPTRLIDLIQGSFDAYRGVRLIALGETGVGKTTFWQYAETGRVDAEPASQTMSVENLGRFAVRDLKQGFVTQRVRAIDVPGHLWDTWGPAVALANPHGIVLLCDHAAGGTTRQADERRLERHVEAIRHISNIVADVRPAALERVALVMNKSDVWKHEHTLPDIVDPSGISSSLASLAQIAGVSTTVRDSSARFGDNVRTTLAWLAGH